MMVVINQPLLILGTRTLALEIADLASDIEGIHVAGFVENIEHERCQETLDGLPIYWVEEVVDLINTHRAVCGLATTLRSRFTDQVTKLGLKFASLTHPSTRLSKKSTVDEGSILSAGVVIGSYTSLGKHVFVNRGVLIGHHTHIGDYVTIQPGANIAGKCRIGNATYIGIGSIILDHLKIGSHSVIGAGSLVTMDVPDHVMVVGSPAQIVKKDIQGM